MADNVETLNRRGDDPNRYMDGNAALDFNESRRWQDDVTDPEDSLAYASDEVVADQPLAEATDFSAEDDATLSVDENLANHYTNIIGIVGFVISIVSICSGWFYSLSWIVWLTGLIFSLVGLSMRPRGFAIAGVSISGAYAIIVLIAWGMGIL